jgi:succinyl-CoA synthetase alpha subunit
MSILIDETTRVLVQGITGREGQVRAKLMIEYGTRVLCGTSPGRGGSEVHGLPVYDTVEEAVEKHGAFDASVIYVPAPLVKDAALEAIAAGVKLLVLVPDRVPIHDVLCIAEEAELLGARFLGPNTLGVLSPGKGVLGMMGGRAEAARRWFLPGKVGVTSRSGGITSAIGHYLSRRGIGLSTLVHVGGDAVVGLPHPEILKLFEADPETEAIVMFGEIGTSQEERAAELMASGAVSKPVVCFVGGKSARKGTRFSHAGAIVEGDRGSHETKVRLLKEAGACVVERFDDIPEATAEVLGRLGALTNPSGG